MSPPPPNPATNAEKPYRRISVASRTIKGLLITLALVVTAQALYLHLAHPPRPSLDRVVRTTPFGEHSAIYEVESNAGGATVGLSYLYFVDTLASGEAQVLDNLKQRTPFLITRQPNAITGTQGWLVKASTQSTVYQFSSLTVVHENNQAVPVNIELNATVTPEG